MVKDVQGIEVKVGDKVAFAGGGKGASEFYVGTVLKITNKGIKISYKQPQYLWNYETKQHQFTGKFYELESQRNGGMFAILGRNNND